MTDTNIQHRLRTDPRMQTTLYATVLPPLVYGVARYGFERSNGLSLAAAAAVGIGIYAMGDTTIYTAMQSLLSNTQTLAQQTPTAIMKQIDPLGRRPF